MYDVLRGLGCLKLKSVGLQLGCSNLWNHFPNRRAPWFTMNGLPTTTRGPKFNPIHLYSSSSIYPKSPESNTLEQQPSDVAAKAYPRIPDHLVRPHSKWTPMMDEKLVNVALLKSKRTWKMFAAEYFPEFTGKQICDRYKIIKQPSVKGKWSEKEINLLKKAVSRFGSDWMAVAKQVKTRNSNQCCLKWIFLEDHSIGRTPWTDVEKEELINLVLKCPGFKTEQGIPDYSDVDWKKISVHFTGKTRFQCEQHFLRNLSDCLRSKLEVDSYDKGRWTNQQSEKLISLVEKYPGKWALISCKMRTRSFY